MRLNDNWRGVRGNVRWFAAAVALAATGAMCLPAAAVELRPGDLLVSTFTGEGTNDTPVIVHVDSVTRNSTLLSGWGVGAGPELTSPVGIAILGNSAILAADGDRILRINPSTGDRVIFSGDGVGAGDAFEDLYGLWLADANSLLAVDRGSKSVVRVDVATGDRTVISSPTVGAGPELLDPYDVTTTLDGRIIVPSFGATIADDEYHGFIVAIDPATGDRSILSDTTHGGGPGYVSPLGIARLSDGRLLVSDNWPAKIFAVDPISGSQTVFSQSGTLPINQFASPLAIALGPDGTVYFTDGNEGGVLTVDPQTGMASVFAPGVQGDGVWVPWGSGLAVVQVPEPAGMVLAPVGGGVLIAAFARRRIRVRDAA